MLEANISFCDTVLVSWGWDCWSESLIWLWWRKLLNSSLGFLFFLGFSRGKHLFFLLFVKRDLKPSVAYWNGSMRVWPLCVSWWTANNSAPEERTRCKTTLASYTRPSGHRSEGFWPELSALFGFLEQHTHAQSRTMSMLGLVKLNISGSAPTQRALSRMQMPWLEWRVEHFFFFFNCVFLCISPGLITGLCRAWVGGRGCVREAVAEWIDEKVEGLISLGIALLFSAEWPLIALATPLRLITAGPYISHGFCCWWWLVWSTQFGVH